jgi:threonine dehydratase
MVTLEDVRKARSAISPYTYKTPLIYSDSLSHITGAEVFLKCENLQKTGSFKVRGAFNKLSNIGEKGDVRALAASMGNHAQGVAYAAKTLGMGATIVMPVGVSASKENAVRAYGAEVMLYGESLMEALGHAVSLKGFRFIHPYDDDDVIAGQGTVGLEVFDDLADVDYILVPVGGGGLISGIAVSSKSISPKTRVIGVQTEAATSGAESFGKRAPVEVPARPTLADGIAVERVGQRTLEIMNEHVDDVLTVSEAAIARAITLILERKKLVAEGAGSVPLALLLERPEAFRGKRTVLILSGGNIDLTLMDRIIHRGLLESGRIWVFGAVLDDAPGELHKLTGILAARRSNILGIEHERFGLPVGKARVRVTIEIKNSGHLAGILSEMGEKGIIVEEGA